MRLELMTYALRKRSRDDATGDPSIVCGEPSSVVAGLVAAQTYDDCCEPVVASESSGDSSLSSSVGYASRQEEFLAAIQGILALPLADDEKAEAIRRLLVREI